MSVFIFYSDLVLEHLVHQVKINKTEIKLYFDLI